MYATSEIKPGRKRLRLAAYSDLEEALFGWFRQARNMNVPLSGPTLKIKAKELPLKLSHWGFQYSIGLLKRFKSKHEIVF